MARIINLILLGLMITACNSGTPSETAKDVTEPVSFYDCTWQWESTTTPEEKITVPNPERYTILFSPDMKADIRFDCNRGGGDFTILDNKISFGPLISTRMACPEDTLDAEFMRDLQGVQTFFIQGDNLFLELPADSGTMKFGQAPGEM